MSQCCQSVRQRWKCLPLYVKILVPQMTAPNCHRLDMKGGLELKNCTSIHVLRWTDHRWRSMKGGVRIPFCMMACLFNQYLSLRQRWLERWTTGLGIPYIETDMPVSQLSTQSKYDEQSHWWPFSILTTVLWGTKIGHVCSSFPIMQCFGW